VTLAEAVRERLDVASALNSGHCGGSYFEAMILMSAVLSGLAAGRWPGDGIDKKRFVELWAAFSDPVDVRISVPLLIRTLRADGRENEATVIETSRPNLLTGAQSLVLVDDDVDMAEGDLRGFCPDITLQYLRKHSYPVLFYRHVRSTLVHEYALGAKASPTAMTRRPPAVSYLNQISVHRHRGVRRLIHFHPEWLKELVLAIALRLEHASPVQGRPSRWWIEG
jgi:hypothetical protein